MYNAEKVDIEILVNLKNGCVCAVIKSRKKRKRKPILPKGFDPANPGPPPDPERWLPKTQRSDFRKKKRGQHLRAQQAAIKGSQGAGKVQQT